MERYICIHGHFYQPPRENPWLEAIEVQETALPYHDWNERITAECYGRNATSRILDAHKKIVEIVNNYSKISFNFGPTLLSWLEKQSPDVYQAILEADRISQKNFSGHGSALAQVYNHLIMPLANSRDKKTQIIWGIKDFEYRFKRFPEGMWLSETAVDLETLDLMAQEGIKFTILAPHQAKRIKKIETEASEKPLKKEEPKVQEEKEKPKVEEAVKWKNVTAETLDFRMPYLCKLPSGRTMNIFFYHGPTSQAVAFQGLLNSGEDFAYHLKSIFTESKTPQLVHIATDGETYGHHHKFGDMALAYCLCAIEAKQLAKLTNYGEFLSKFPPTHEAEIVENSSWSCNHGLERWRSNCGCRIGTHAEWHQKWRKPLREALDWLSDESVKIFETEMGHFVPDVWQLRNQYIEVVLNRSSENIDRFLKQHVKDNLSDEENVRVLKLLEIQFNTQLMYTSCGWFFDEVSGIESTQVLKYAARVIQLSKEINGNDLENVFLSKLELIPSNVPEIQNGAQLYKMFIHPSVVDLLRVGAHYAMTSLFEEYPEDTQLYCYMVKSDMYDRQEAGRLKLAIGRGWVRSNIVLEKNSISFVVLHFGDHNFIAGVDYFKSPDEFILMKEDIEDAFQEGNIPEVISLVSKYYHSQNYSLWHLFKDEQQKILQHVLKTTLDEIEGSFRQIYEHHYPLLQIKDDIQLSLPRTLVNIVEFILCRDLAVELERETLNVERFHKIIEEMKHWPLERDKEHIRFIADKKINELMAKFQSAPEDIDLIQLMEMLLINLNQLNLDLDLWKAQNTYFAIGKKFYNEKKQKATEDPLAQLWVESFETLGEILQVEII